MKNDTIYRLGLLVNLEWYYCQCKDDGIHSDDYAKAISHVIEMIRTFPSTKEYDDVSANGTNCD